MPGPWAGLRRLWRDEEGAASSEYVLLATLIAMAVLAGVSALGQSVLTLYTNTVGALTS